MRPSSLRHDVRSRLRAHLPVQLLRADLPNARRVRTMGATQDSRPSHLYVLICGTRAHTQIPSYASAKAALENFARCMALEYASTGIRVNVVSPGNVAAGSSLKVFEEDPAYREFVLRVSLGKRNSPESIADAFVFLCSPLACEISGQIVSADYGSGVGNRL